MRTYDAYKKTNYIKVTIDPASIADIKSAAIATVYCLRNNLFEANVRNLQGSEYVKAKGKRAQWGSKEAAIRALKKYNTCINILINVENSHLRPDGVLSDTNYLTYTPPNPYLRLTRY